jgi:NADPH:quinone reductase-like Zn-dependent oxidoreductase
LDLHPSKDGRWWPDYYLLLKNIEISGLQISDYRERCPAQVAACFSEVFRLYEQGKVKPTAATAFPLARAASCKISGVRRFSAERFLCC